MIPDVPDALRPRLTTPRLALGLALLFAMGVGAGDCWHAARHPDAPPAAPGAPR